MQPEKKYKTDVAAAEVEMDVLRLPVGHCELNPIELVWENVKHYAAANNKDFTMVEIERLSKEGSTKLQRKTGPSYFCLSICLSI